MLLILASIIIGIIFFIVALFGKGHIEPINIVWKKDFKCSAGEKACRDFLEDHFGKPFPRKRPTWLKAEDSTYPLELDCFNEELNIALEYQGEQHYKYNPYFHKTREDFNKQLQRDLIKKAICRERKINLIIVPYYIDKENIGKFIKNKLMLAAAR